MDGYRGKTATFKERTGEKKSGRMGTGKQRWESSKMKGTEA
jgi:hypothetical protein